MKKEMENAWIKELSNFLDSEEGKEHARKFFKNLESKNSIKEKRVLKICSLSKEELYNLIDKSIKKYETLEYINRYYKRGYEPNYMLFRYIYDAIEYLFNKKEKGITILTTGPHISYFNNIAYNLDNKYIFRILHGQGSVCQIYKI